MVETIRNAWKIPELRKKLLFTMLIIVVFRFAHTINVPFVDTEFLSKTFQAQSAGNLLGYFNILAGGGLQTASILALSIYPYINSSIIMQLLQVAIPALERMVKEGGEEGKKKIEAITRIVTLVLSLVMGYSYFLMLNSSGYQGVLSRNDAWAVVVILATFTAGSMFVMWLGEQITQKGVGNGISIILFIGIVSRGPALVSSLISGFRDGSMVWWKLLIILVLAIAIIAFIVFITNAERRIPVQYAKRVIGRKQYGGQNTHLPMKVNMSGVMPVIFASTITTVPGTIAAFFTPKVDGFWFKMINSDATLGKLGWFIPQPASVAYILVYVLLIFGFAYFYSTIQFNPIEVANNLRKNGGFIPGFRPGKPTSDFIARVLGKITMMGAIFLAIIAGLPLIMSNIQGLAGLSIGGTSVLIMVSVALETVKAIESQMLMRHYKGFLE